MPATGSWRPSCPLLALVLAQQLLLARHLPLGAWPAAFVPLKETLVPLTATLVPAVETVSHRACGYPKGLPLPCSPITPSLGEASVTDGRMVGGGLVGLTLSRVVSGGDQA